MDILALIVIAVGLSLDEFAVAIAVSLGFKGLDWERSFRLVGTFTAFHAVMLILGFYLGTELLTYIEHIDHWLAFGLLAVVGARMMWDAFQEGDTYSAKRDPTKGMELFMLGLATSIDALAIGLSFAALHEPILVPLVVILVMVFIFGIVGTRLGPLIGKKAGRYAEVMGGIVLILLGVKVLAEHYL
jgi:putative Mn2+ efflux pump MntP